MYKIVGALLLIAGSIGFGGSINYERKRNIDEIDSFIYVFEMLKSRIQYQREVLSEACLSISRKTEGKMKELLHQIGYRCEMERQQEFEQCWKEEMTEYFRTSSLDSRSKMQLLAFPQYIGFSDQDMQLNVITEYICRLQRIRQELYERNKERKRVVMGVCTVGGIAITILLL